MAESLKIGNKGVKLICLRVKPGYEFEVADSIRSGSGPIGINDLVIVKGFGHWDLLIIHEQDDISPSLGRIGPFPYILNTTVFSCFQYDHKFIEPFSIISIIQNNLFTVFSFLKLNIRAIDSSIPSLEKALVNRLNKIFKQNYLLLGTLGWNEFVLILYSKDLEPLLKGLYELNFIPECCDGSSNFFLKSFSNITINFQSLVDLRSLDKLDATNIKENFKAKLQNDLAFSKEYLPTINVSARPNDYMRLIQYWSALSTNFNIKIFYGDFDFSVTPKEGTEWSCFLSALLTFRYIYRENISGTHTVFNYYHEFSDNNHGSECRFPPLMPPSSISNLTEEADWSYDELTRCVGLNVAPSVASIFYRLNSGLQDPIISECFESLKKAPRAIIRTAIKSFGKRTKSEILYTALNCARILNEAIEIRLYGTPGNLQRNFAHFESIGGGMHRSIMALEFLPKHIYHTFNMNNQKEREWEGFITISGSKFEIFQEMLTVPASALWRPYLIWCEYHECCHMLMENTNFLDYQNDKRVTSFINIHPQNKKEASELVIEIIAEIIGYKLGFFGDIKLFKTLLWDYIIEISTSRPDAKNLWVYLFRTFCVELYERIYSTEINHDSKIDITSLRNVNEVYGLYLTHINDFLTLDHVADKLPENLRQHISEIAKSKAAMNAPRIKYLESLLSKIN